MAVVGAAEAARKDRRLELTIGRDIEHLTAEKMRVGGGKAGQRV